MERVQELIDKLWKQYQRQEGPESLLTTVQQLHDTLSVMVRAEVPKGGGKVAVVLPPKRRIATVEVAPSQPAAQKPAPAITEAPAPAPAPVATPSQPEIPEQHKAFAGMAAPVEPPLPATAPVALQPEPLRQPYSLSKPPASEVSSPVAPVVAPEPETVQVPEERLVAEPVVVPEAAPAEPLPVAQQPAVIPQPQPEQQEEREVFHLHFDMPEEAPTLTQQFAQGPKELHELIGQKGESLNDRLKQERTELGNKLKETPIKDLRKAIGLNDKFLFIKELFRGDEAMYERSIKTINNFHILQEAEYWISRELKVKLGWDDGSDAAQSFYQLVRRRFA